MKSKTTTKAALQRLRKVYGDDTLRVEDGEKKTEIYFFNVKTNIADVASGKRKVKKELQKQNMNAK